MLYALHKKGDLAILQTMEIPESLIGECTPEGFAAVVIDASVSGATHIIVDGRPVLKPKEGA